jgi:hypothetical protein
MIYTKRRGRLQRERDLEERVYMKQPKGFIMEGKEDMGCRLKKSIYGLKQASR